MALLKVIHLVREMLSRFKLSQVDFQVPFSPGNYLFPRLTNMQPPSSGFGVKEDASIIKAAPCFSFCEGLRPGVISVFII